MDNTTNTVEELKAAGWKVCSTCGELKEPDAFYKSKRRDGMAYSCKVCHRKAVRGYRKIPDSYAFWYRRLEKLKRNARKRGLEFNLTVEDYKFIKSGETCYYCQAETDIITLDRKDNFKGYTTDNIVGCCYYCNKLKSNLFNEEEMKIIGRAVRMKHARDKRDNKKDTSSPPLDNFSDKLIPNE